MGNKQSGEQEKVPARLSKITGISKDEYKKKYKVFMKNNPSGEIPKDKFRQRIRESGNPLFEHYRDEEIDHIFNFYDLDGSGAVDFYEFEMSCFMLTKKKSPEEFIELCIKLIDIDGNGSVEKDELVRPYRRLFEKLPEMSKVLPEEVNTPEKVVDAIFRDVDTDNSGNLSASELIHFMREHPDKYEYYGLNLVFGTN